MAKSPQDRMAAIAPAVERLGGKVKDGYLSFGDYDTDRDLRVPRRVDAAASRVAVSAGGACKSFKTTPLLTAEEGMNAMKKAGGTSYRPPG